MQFIENELNNGIEVLKHKSSLGNDCITNELILNIGAEAKKEAFDYIHQPENHQVSK